MRGVRRGVLITFEGVEGSGKTTQAKNLVAWLEQRKITHIFVREPGGTMVGEAIRNILLNPAYKEMYRKCEVLLFLAARSQLIYERILPAIKQKQVVVADRFYDSTYAYQVCGRDLPRRLISVFNRFATAGVKTDLTFLFDLDIAKGRKRGIFDDRMETAGNTYHEKVREAYLQVARRAKKRIKILDGEKDLDELENEVIAYAKAFLTKKGYKL
jgi:dTMP kinase